VTMGRELIEAKIGHDDDAVPRRRDGLADREIEDSVLVARGRSRRVSHRGDGEQHDAADARIGRRGHRFTHACERQLGDAGERSDRVRRVDSLLDEQRQHELP